ncbi:heat shock 70 kDa protein 12A-like [Argopecten irradians]|uniref:heat shock 70 kDa protein 12A-like n=1 Tax=Argopecten irradians TaxID=31199 RepID=UPI00371F3757
MDGKTNHIISAAIDFGTTFSGYAYSTRGDFRQSPDKVSCPVWNTRSGYLQSLTTSTCVLFNPDNTFSEFGFQAEDKYFDLAEEENEKEWYFLRRFKMELYKTKAPEDIELKSFGGKTLPAMYVFSAAIEYLKNQLLETCGNHGFDLRPHDIQWVLTVPAIWDDSAKLFMRKAAVKAGILSETLLLVLEPEAAAVYCKSILATEHGSSMDNTILGNFKPGTKNMVVDAGGGTVDITVHQVQDGGTLREVCAAGGGDWGGTMVDKDFVSLLRKIFGHDIFDTFQREHIDDSLDILRDLEQKKRTVFDKPDGSISILVPGSLLETRQGFKSPTAVEYDENIVFKRNKLLISSKCARSLFESSIEGIVNQLKKMMDDPRVADISSIIMVGGYSECSFLQERVIKEFPTTRVIVPPEGALAVLKGAVITGHTPSAITHRVCRYTYGIGLNSLFRKGVHDEKRKYVDARGKVRCSGTFEKQVTIGDVIKVGHKGERLVFQVKNETSTKIIIQIYVSLQPNPAYVNHDGCKKLGLLVVDMPDTTKGLNRGVSSQMVFGGSEINVEASDIDTGQRFSVNFDFL